MKNIFLMSCLFLSFMHYDFASEQRSPQLQQAVYLFTNAQSQFINRKISSAEFDKKIYEQSKNMAREEVKAKNEEIIVKQKISSVGYLASIKKALMAWSGYEVTDEQKQARQDFDILLQQKEIIENEYVLAELDDELTSVEKEELKKHYNSLIIRINDEITQQQMTINNRWSLLKKAIVAGMVVSAATVAGLLFTNNWWGIVENK